MLNAKRKRFEARKWLEEHADELESSSGLDSITEVLQTKMVQYVNAIYEAGAVKVEFTNEGNLIVTYPVGKAAWGLLFVACSMVIRLCVDSVQFVENTNEKKCEMTINI